MDKSMITVEWIDAIGEDDARFFSQDEVNAFMSEVERKGYEVTRVSIEYGDLDWLRVKEYHSDRDFLLDPTYTLKGKKYRMEQENPWMLYGEPDDPADLCPERE